MTDTPTLWHTSKTEGPIQMPESPNDQPGAPESTDTPTAAVLPSESEVVARAQLTSSGRTYRILRTSEVDPYEEPLPVAAVPSFDDVEDLAVAEPAGRRRRPSGDEFGGTARRAAKISIANATVEEFADLPALLASLPRDAAMVRHRPRITDAAGMDRVAEERRNVRVRAFLYAASREDDNDFHLIIGNARTPGPFRCMTMELSGLPPAGSPARARLQAARDAYKAFFATNLPGTSYDFYDPPIPVEIEGSLFFDISHAEGSKPGPSSLRPFIPTVWEVHPISRIVFEP
jgi:hypothetical protein